MFISVTASGQVIWDFGPTSGTPAGVCYTNEAAGQNFTDDFSFAEPMTLTGMDIWSCSSFGASAAHIKIHLDDGGGNPGAIFTEWDQAVASVVDGSWYRISADFAGVSLDAGQIYWIGMSPNSGFASQLTVNTPGDGSIAMFSGSTFLSHPTVGDQMYQLRGALTAVDIPDLSGYGIATLVLLIGVVGIIGIRRLY
jgi:hypothetical protein